MEANQVKKKTLQAVAWLTTSDSRKQFGSSPLHDDTQLSRSSGRVDRGFLIHFRVLCVTERWLHHVDHFPWKRKTSGDGWPPGVRVRRSGPLSAGLSAPLGLVVKLRFNDDDGRSLEGSVRVNVWCNSNSTLCSDLRCLHHYAHCV